MIIALYKVVRFHGALLMADTVQTLDVETIPDNIDELLEDAEADFYEVLND